MTSEKIDIGFLNSKQFDRLIKEVRNSKIPIIEVHVLKLQKEMSMILEFRSENEKKLFDRQSEKLIKDLNRLRRPLCKQNG